MAHHTSAQKAIRQTKTRTLVNKARKSRVKTFIKKVETAVAASDKAAAETALVTVQSELARAVNKGIFKKNTASRKVSRLTAKVKALA